MQLESAALRDFKPADDSSGESNHTVHARRDAFLENCFFYISRLYEFLHSLGQSRRNRSGAGVGLCPQHLQEPTYVQAFAATLGGPAPRTTAPSHPVTPRRLQSVRSS